MCLRCAPTFVCVCLTCWLMFSAETMQRAYCSTNRICTWWCQPRFFRGLLSVSHTVRQDHLAHLTETAVETRNDRNFLPAHFQCVYVEILYHMNNPVMTVFVFLYIKKNNFEAFQSVFFFSLMLVYLLMTGVLLKANLLIYLCHFLSEYTQVAEDTFLVWLKRNSPTLTLKTGLTVCGWLNENTT